MARRFYYFRVGEVSIEMEPFEDEQESCSTHTDFGFSVAWCAGQNCHKKSASTGGGSFTTKSTSCEKMPSKTGSTASWSVAKKVNLHAFITVQNEP
ncbi:hypothetical protein K1T71_000070 [Dendrolimus kikuchii]|uniref:Uncharacterized protein n=1 Tax=Dendrolimus kikuchii TaxID=765133 RepID=A0ACC1DIC8_9NEOP|nr:hypothetical protein K1T71_000070 [Dendrolimus kikuchii]